MKRFGYRSFVIAAVLIASAVVGAEKNANESGATAAAEHKMFDPASMTWGDGPPFLPPGVKFALLSGDPTKTGVFTIRLRMPAGYKIPPHTHPTAELITPISGSLHLGTGAAFDEGAGHTMPPGSFM
ncbi:MAG TPA: cupin domain-containing protein, partial [Chthoniobacterales bacterium]